MKADEELCISYVDTADDAATRRATLQAHYEFDCGCDRCADAKRNALRAKARARGKDHVANTSRLARESYMHDLAGGGNGRSTGI